MNIIHLIGLYFMPMYLIFGGQLLIVDFVPFASYTNLITAIVDTLAPYHNITLLSIAHNNFNHPNVTVIKLNEPNLHIVSKNEIFHQLQSKHKFDLMRNTILSITKECVDSTFTQNKILQDIVANKTKFDLFFCFSHISEHLLPLAHVSQAHFIQLSPSAPLPWQSDSVGNPIFLSTDHTLITDEDPDYFSCRIYNYVKHLILTFMYYQYYLPNIDKLVRIHYPPETPSIEEILSNTSVLLINTVEVMGFSRPTESNTIEVGGLHCRPAQKLPTELDNFIQKSPNSEFIYVSFGTTISAAFPEKFLNALINVLSKLPYQILWKVNKDIKSLPSNIMASKWFPQQDILGHPKIKLLITHGGMLSLQEAVYHAVPILIIPITFDQPFNAYTVNKIGYGRYLLFSEVSEETLLNEIQEVVTNPSYKQKIKILSNLMRDQLSTAAQRLIWWTNFIIRHNGYPIYRSNFNKYTWKKSIEIDILFSFLFILVLVYYLLKYILLYIKYSLQHKIKLKKI